MPEDAHDRVQSGAALGELGADGVSEPVRGDRRLARDVDETGGLAGGLERIVEQVEQRQDTALAGEQAAGGALEVVAGQGPVGVPPPQGLHLPYGVGGLIGERHGAFGVGLAGG